MANVVKYYKDEDIIEYKGVKIYEIPDLIDITPQKDDFYHPVKSSVETLRSIAFYHYDNSRFWRIIGDFNAIIDPQKPLKVGQKLRCPSKNRLYGEILNG